MLKIKKAITVLGILNNLLSLTLFLTLFCLSGNLYAQMPPALDFPPGREFDPRHPLEPRESGISPSAISENVEFVGATGGAVYDVFVFASLSSLPSVNRQDNYAYVCAGGTLTILDVSAPSNPTKVGYVTIPDLAYTDFKERINTHVR